MEALKKRLGAAAVAVLGMMFAGVAGAAPVVMNFDHMNPQGEYIDNYYNGGCGGSWNGGGISCNGPNYGVTWMGAVTWQNSGDSAVGNEPSPSGFMGAGYGWDPAFSSVSCTSGNCDTYMNVVAGFTGGFSFFYSDPYAGDNSIAVYSGLNGTGSVLATSTLPQTQAYCIPSAPFSCWNPLGVVFSGTAQSVVFIGGDANIDGGGLHSLGFDNVTLGSATPVGAVTSVPEPAELGMFGFGMLLIGAFVGLRRRGLEHAGEAQSPAAYFRK